ncbi:XdhC family protein (plasmid) [Ensifer adhaerens]|uniref:XdhC family protein n=1 Tax=Ensifer adhaerens TaxID=106592 RepID=UPI001CBBDA76|nr:XdhC family protein [Ensifer adhaerens]MBZ7927405.1 XdhC family protein [Ensifer adhaerens]UAX97837.1 XdhC family protein [Ensifer adhaerens]UAY05216.1 XdhC family protein [Ensifer adhaerens]UAY12594.1 XdhC family protein [Ensifer adhaerens]
MAGSIATYPDSFAPEPRAAFLSDDAADILAFAAECLEGGHKAALVTLVEIRGGAARALGAQMVVREDGFYCGFVSGGCTEAAVAAEAMTAIGKDMDRNLRLGEGSPFFDIVLPCGGGITLTIHVLRDATVLHLALTALDRRTPMRLRYHPGKRTLSVAPGEGPSGWDGPYFLRAYRPKPRLLIAGTPLEAQVVSRLAVACGYEVVVLARSEQPSADQLDADTAVALLFHDIDRELPVLNAALASKAFYVGALGSRRTHAKRCEALRRCGYGDDDIARIRAPIGIFDKARDASSLAVSVVADIAHARVGYTA